MLSIDAIAMIIYPSGFLITWIAYEAYMAYHNETHGYGLGFIPAIFWPILFVAFIVILPFIIGHSLGVLLKKVLK